MLKRIVRIFLVIILLLVVAIIALPVVFEGKVVEMVKQETNKQVNAQVDFGEFDLSLIKSFPNFYFEINDVSVRGIDTFENVQLLKLGKLYVTIDLMSVVSGSEVNIKSVGMENTYVDVQVLKGGIANYDIAKASTEEEVEEEAPETESSTAFKLGLSSYNIKNFNLVYNDRDLNVFTEIKNLNHQGKGDFTLDKFLLETATQIEAFTMKYEGIGYLNKASADIVFNMDMDMPNMAFAFKDNSFKINDLVLKFEGNIAMPTDDIAMDLRFSAPQNTFKSVLSLIPAVYAKDFADLTTAGEFAINGFAKGIYTETNLPAFGLDLMVKNGRFQYPDLPKSAENIQVDLSVKNSGGSEDNTLVDLKSFHVELAENPFDMNFYLSNPISDPYLRGALQTQLDFDKLKEVIPAGEESYTGSITANMNFEGRMSTLENEEYEKFDAKGNLVMSGFNYTDPTLDFPVAIEKANLSFSPRATKLSQFDLKLGKSDISATGELSNYLPYYFHEQVLTGNLTITSTLIDSDQLMGEETVSAEEAEESTEADSTEVYEIVEIPKNIAFETKANMAKILYDGMTIEHIQGRIAVKDGKVILDNTDLEMLQGKVTMSGEYSTVDLAKPSFDFEMAIEKFDVEETFETFNTMKKMAPIGENAKGAFSCAMDVTGTLLPNYEPNMNSLSGGGKLTTHEVVIGDSKFLNQAADLLKNDKYRKLELNNVDVQFAFEDGKIVVEPFDMNLGETKATVQGANYFDERIDYLIKLEAPTSEFGGTAASAAGALQGLLAQAGISSDIGEKIKVDLAVTGTATDPKISPSFGGSSGAASSVKDKAKEALNQQKEELEKKAKEEVDKAKKEAEAKAKAEKEKLIRDANAKGDKLIAEAEKQGQQLRTQAKSNGDKLIAEAEKQRSQLVKDAGKNPLKKKAAEVAGDKLVKEAKSKADKLNDEADKKAKDLVVKAKAEKQKLVSAAESN